MYRYIYKMRKGKVFRNKTLTSVNAIQLKYVVNSFRISVKYSFSTEKRFISLNRWMNYIISLVGKPIRNIFSANWQVTGYNYPVPTTQGAASSTRAQTQPAPTPPRPSASLERLPSASAQEQSVQQVWKFSCHSLHYKLYP